MEWKTWQVCCTGKIDALRFELKECREGICWKGRGRSFYVEGLSSCGTFICSITVKPPPLHTMPPPPLHTHTPPCPLPSYIAMTSSNSYTSNDMDLAEWVVRNGQLWALAACFSFTELFCVVCRMFCVQVSQVAAFASRCSNKAWPGTERWWWILVSPHVRTRHFFTWDGMQILMRPNSLEMRQCSDKNKMRNKN